MRVCAPGQCLSRILLLKMNIEIATSHAMDQSKWKQDEYRWTSKCHKRFEEFRLIDFLSFWALANTPNQLSFSSTWSCLWLNSNLHEKAFFSSTIINPSMRRSAREEFFGMKIKVSVNISARPLMLFVLGRNKSSKLVRVESRFVLSFDGLQLLRAFLLSATMFVFGAYRSS